MIITLCDFVRVALEKNTAPQNFLGTQFEMALLYSQHGTEDVNDFSF